MNWVHVYAICDIKHVESIFIYCLWTPYTYYVWWKCLCTLFPTVRSIAILFYFQINGEKFTISIRISCECNCVSVFISFSFIPFILVFTFWCCSLQFALCYRVAHCFIAIFFETANGIRFTMLEKCLCTYFTPSSRKVNWNDISNNTDALTLNIYFSMCVWVAVGLLENQVLLIVFMKRIACSMLWVFCVWLRPMIIRHTILDSQMEHGYIVLVPGASQNETSKNEIFTHFSKLDYPSIYIFYYLYFAIASNGHTHSWMRATTEKRALRAVTNCVLASRKCICVMLNDKNQREINTFICISNKYS